MKCRLVQNYRITDLQNCYRITDLGMIEYYQKTCGWNSKSTKTKKYVKNYSRYSTLKNRFLCVTLGYVPLIRMLKSLIYN